ncbi:hypothetical protein CALVIDRAFT_556120 [Calocera viscosa TUFC12733]|uniref:Protein CPL1-like domain-containing protein n=1 Tax=Calocera viscosa (strain TUFC12733) TaxID=1330018 RepID=A0A167KRD6_CALVF|nr:hypothetical protein CALVIDRAFT_556120 [Calocera viscosa TUFC12733]
MKIPALALFLFICACVSASAVWPRGSSFPRDSTPSKRWLPSGRSLERAAELTTRELPWEDDRCPKAHTACGVSSPWTKQGWECIDTLRDLESCGGCVYPLPGRVAGGVDCTDIDGVEDVSCMQGFCVVNSCREGYAVSADGQSCDAVSRKKPGLHQAPSINHF